MVTSRIWFTAHQRPLCLSAGVMGRGCAYLAGAGKEEQDRALSGSLYSMEGSRRRGGAALGLRSGKRFPRHCGGPVASADRPVPRTGAINSKSGDQAQRQQSGVSYQPGRYAWERALRPKPCRLGLHRELRWRVARKLALQWSPEQISGWLKQESPTDQDMQISREAIYRSRFIQTRGVLKKELTAQLRTAR
jgi:hypothetical protein